MQVPDTLPLMMGQGCDETISKILSNPDDHINNIILLSSICKIKITFNEPFTVWLNTRRAKLDLTEHTFGGFFSLNGNLYYRLSKTSRRGQHLPVNNIKSYEPVRDNLLFKNFEQFKKKFDPYFITEEYIKKLWEETSCQTGERYAPSDFRQIGPAGKKALQSFLLQFRGVSNVDPSTYTPRTYQGDSYYIAEGGYSGTGVGNFSKDISVEHRLGKPVVFYCSEQTGGGKSRSGFVVSKTTYLWLEDD
jgi:hypothetical protein